MNQLPKILKVLFVILLLVTFGEVGYYLYYQNNQENNKQIISKRQFPEMGTIDKSSLKNIISPTQSLQPFPTLEWLDKHRVDSNYRTVNPNIAIDPKVIHALNYYKKDILQESTIKNIFNGKIVEIDRNSSKAFYDYYDYKLKIKIASRTDSNIWNIFYFSEDDLSKTQFVKADKDKETAFSLNDLNVGDAIRIEYTIDALKSEPITSPGTTYYLTRSWGFNTINIKIVKL